MLLLLLLIRTRRDKAFRCMFRNLRQGTPSSSLLFLPRVIETAVGLETRTIMDRHKSLVLCVC
jgi:hypothetical protein